MRWDIFCRVIDNFGDIGVCWRLAADLAARGHTVRLWVDDASGAGLDGARQGCAGVSKCMAWTTAHRPAAGITPGDVVVEAFGCEIAPEFIAAYAHRIRARGQKVHRSGSTWNT